MMAKTAGASIAVMALLSFGAIPNAARADKPSASCTDLAAKHALHGSARRHYVARCMKAVSSPPEHNGGLANNVVTAPSGESPANRSNRCAAEADRRGLKDSLRQAFQHSCLAEAAPVTTTGTRHIPPSKRAAKPDLGVVSNGEQH